MKTLYGNDLKYLPNRLRKCTKFKNEPKSLHIEAHELFKVEDGNIKLIPGEIATIVGLTELDDLDFWDMKDLLMTLNHLRNITKNTAANLL